MGRKVISFVVNEGIKFYQGSRPRAGHNTVDWEKSQSGNGNKCNSPFLKAKGGMMERGKRMELLWRTNCLQWTLWGGLMSRYGKWVSLSYLLKVEFNLKWNSHILGKNKNSLYILSMPLVLQTGVLGTTDYLCLGHKASLQLILGSKSQSLLVSSPLFINNTPQMTSAMLEKINVSLLFWKINFSFNLQPWLT